MKVNPVVIIDKEELKKELLKLEERYEVCYNEMPKSTEVTGELKGGDLVKYLFLQIECCQIEGARDFIHELLKAE